jgi:hypothetical protein
MHGRSPIDPSLDEAERSILTGKHRWDRPTQAGPGHRAFADDHDDLSLAALVRR